MTFNKSLQYIAFGESENITIQVSLVSSWSYVKIDYGITKQRLDSGKKEEETNNNDDDDDDDDDVMNQYGIYILPLPVISRNPRI